jgi:hypothetical protein
MGKKKGYNSSHVYCQAKGWSKRARKTFSMILERVFKWYDGGGENGITSKMIFEVQVFSPLKILTSPFYLSRLLELFFFFFFHFSSLFSFFYASSLEDLGILMIFKEEITSSKTSFQMA